MASSRVFIKGLPPTLSESEFRKHFSLQGTVTDARLFQNRRIGYIGYDSPEIAAKAVKYFNRTFMRMSKIAVELATPVADRKPARPTNLKNASTSSSLPAQEQDQSNSAKRKRGSDDKDLANFLEVMQPKKNRLLPDQHFASMTATPQDVAEPKADTEEPIKRRRVESPPTAQQIPAPKEERSEQSTKDPIDVTRTAQTAQAPESGTDGPEQQRDPPLNEPRSDADWLRSRTSRLLGLNDEDDDNGDGGGGDNVQTVANDSAYKPVLDQPSDSDSDSHQGKLGPDDEQTPLQNPDEQETEVDQPRTTDVQASTHEVKIRETKRLFLRNLAFDISEEDLQTSFSRFGTIDEVHIPMSGQTGKPKGFAYITFADGEAAVTAWQELDGKTLKGRLLHVLPAAGKRETQQLDDFALSKLPLKKQQQIKRRREAASTQYNWNSLYMNADSVLSSVAERFNISKSEMLDPTSSDAAVKQAHAETHLIQETKTYFKNNGVDLDSFKSSSRGDTGMLIKNIPHESKASELRDLFEQHGNLKTFLIPPSGIIAIAVFDQAAHAKAAFASLAYRKIHNSVLFLEKAPKNLFTMTPISKANADETLIEKQAKPAISASDLMQNHSDGNTASSTLFVRNLNFTTTSERLVETFKPLDGFLAARVKTKINPKVPDQILSMGFGFVEFRSKSQAQAALGAMDDYKLDDHRLQVRFSQKVTDAAEARRQDEQARRKAAASTKIVIKNLPFEATKKDVRALFGAYGQLRSVRMPMKMDRSIRGFAFADFTTQKEAVNALDALRDTHLLGRRLVLDFAAPEAEDAEAEIAKMQKKVGSQINKVAIQRLTGGGRKKFIVDDPAAAADEDGGVVE